MAHRLFSALVAGWLGGMAFLGADAAPLRSEAKLPPWGCLEYGQEWENAKPLRVHRGEGGASPVVFTLPSKQTFTALSGVIRVLQPVVVQVTEVVSIRSHDDRGAEVGPEYRVVPGDRLEILHPMGETGHMVRLKGQLIPSVWLDLEGEEVRLATSWESEDPVLGRRLALEPKEPQIEWWVKIRDAKGQVGWIEVRDDGRIAWLFDCYD